MILLLRGYLETGKDLFYQTYQTGTVHQYWTIYRADGTRDDHPFWLDYEWTRMAFADELKRQTLFKYHLPPTMSKTDPLPWDASQTYRDLLISESTEILRQCPMYWVDFVNKNRNAENILITDWRRWDEWKTMMSANADEPVITAHIFRASVPVPTYPIEHELDDFKTDYVILDLETSWDKYNTPK